MRPYIYLSLLLFFLTFTAIAQPTYHFEHFSMGITSNNIFTSNNFKCIGVGKGNLIWAGTQYGGLYMYSPTYNIWTKSDKLTNVFINDIKSDPDSGIWIAQSGTSSGAVHSNLAGGVNYFPQATDAIMNFYTVTDYSLSSRNARSLYIDTAFHASTGELPRVWVALSTYYTSGNLTRGGVNVGLNTQSPYLTKVIAGLGLTNNLICESIGGNSHEIWVGTRFNGLTSGNTESRIVRYSPDKSFIDNTFHPSNTPLLQPGFSAQAIFFDSRRDKWIGLKQGGLRIVRDGQWVAMNSSAFFSSSTQVNYNAITEDEFGNVYIGTTDGLLMYKSPKYDPTSNPDNISSYKLFTTTDGLLNNNVTGLAYDKKNGKVLITSSSGVSFLKIKYPHIHGKILDVYTNIESTSNPTSGLQTKPFTVLGRVKAYLYKDGIEKEMVYPDADGSFELKEADETSTYTVEVKHNLPDKTIRYIYNNVRNHTLLEPSLIPDSLIGEIKALIPKLRERCFPVKLYFGLEIKNGICTNDAFDTTGYQTAYEWVYKPEGVTSEHQKHVDNLANYYAALSSVYNLGGQSTDMIFETVSVVGDLFEALWGEINNKEAIAKADLDQVFSDAGEDVVESLIGDYKNTIGLITSMKDVIVYGLGKLLPLVSNDEEKAFLEKVIAGTNEAVDLLLEAAKEGKNGTFLKALKDHSKKLFAQFVAVAYYKSTYVKERHANLVSIVSQAAHNIESNLTYEEVYDNIYNLSTPSLVKLATDTINAGKATMATLSNTGKVADVVSAGTNLATSLGLIPGGQAIAAAARIVSFTAKLVKYFSFLGSIYQGTVSAIDVAEISDQVYEKTQLESTTEISNSSYSNSLVQTSLDSLLARKNRYTALLMDLQPIYAASTFDLNTFKTKRSQLKREDSLFTAEIKTVLNGIISISDTATEVINNFSTRYNRVMDTFINIQPTLKNAYYYRNLAYIAESNKSLDKPGIDSLINELIINSDSIVNGLQSIVTDINNSSINGKAFLVKENYFSTFSRVPGASGSVTYSFKNYGGEPQNNVSFKIEDVGGGYIITSADSVNVGTILPGETKTVTFNFTSPMHDSLSHYRIAVNAANGMFQDEIGAFYTIDPAKCYSAKDGNWNDPSTWVCGVVPGPTNPVVIAHKVTVTANASCKNLSLHSPGELKVEPGKQFTVVQ